MTSKGGKTKRNREPSRYIAPPRHLGQRGKEPLERNVGHDALGFK